MIVETAICSDDEPGTAASGARSSVPVCTSAMTSSGGTAARLVSAASSRGLAPSGQASVR